MTQYTSLYVHFPFCESKCHYCDFYSLGREKTSSKDPLNFENALKREAELYASQLAPRLDSIFFGGGTPSLTPAESMRRALAPLELESRVDENTEWTMEANPSSISAQAFREYRELGVNRISMGVQSKDPELLKKLGRVHDTNEVDCALDVVFSTGFENVSVDLLCGVPGQTLETLEHSMRQLLRFPISHLSCYLLTLPKHHAMFKELPAESEQLKHLEFIDQFMREAGFEHYEISNFARPGRRAKHNLGYWKGVSYLGMGPSAHSYDAEARRRWKNVSSLRKYAEMLTRENKLALEWEELLTPAQEELEGWMLRLRLDEGFPRAWAASPQQERVLGQLEDAGYLETHPEDDTRKRLTPKGFPLSDQIIGMLAPALQA